MDQVRLHCTLAVQWQLLLWPSCLPHGKRCQSMSIGQIDRGRSDTSCTSRGHNSIIFNLGDCHGLPLFKCFCVQNQVCSKMLSRSPIQSWYRTNCVHFQVQLCPYWELPPAVRIDEEVVGRLLSPLVPWSTHSHRMAPSQHAQNMNMIRPCSWQLEIKRRSQGLKG
jgi:hypothetical protein